MYHIFVFILSSNHIPSIYQIIWRSFPCYSSLPLSLYLFPSNYRMKQPWRWRNTCINTEIWVPYHCISGEYVANTNNRCEVRANSVFVLVLASGAAIANIYLSNCLCQPQKWEPILPIHSDPLPSIGNPSDGTDISVVFLATRNFVCSLLVRIDCLSQSLVLFKKEKGSYFRFSVIIPLLVYIALAMLSVRICTKIYVLFS